MALGRPAIPADTAATHCNPLRYGCFVEIGGSFQRVSSAFELFEVFFNIYLYIYIYIHMAVSINWDSSLGASL